MKKDKQILVAIDFSKCSIKGLEYAISIANDINANVMMVHVDKAQSSESMYSKRGSNTTKDWLLHWTNWLQKINHHYKANLNTRLEKARYMLKLLIRQNTAMLICW